MLLIKTQNDFHTKFLIASEEPSLIVLQMGRHKERYYKYSIPFLLSYSPTTLSLSTAVFLLMASTRHSQTFTKRQLRLLKIISINWLHK